MVRFSCVGRTLIAALAIAALTAGSVLGCSTATGHRALVDYRRSGGYVISHAGHTVQAVDTAVPTRLQVLIDILNQIVSTLER